MQKIEEYIELSRKERRAHLKLDEECVERGGYSKEFRGLLAYHLDTSIPRGSKILLCHACNNGGCSNPNHLYWGTPTDNHVDQKESGTYLPLNERMKAKYGEEEYKKMLSNRTKGRKYESKLKYSQQKIDSNKEAIRRHHPTGWGWIGRCANELGISSAQVRRFVKAHMSDEITLRSRE